MTRRTIFRLCVALLLPALAIASAVVPQLSRPGGVSAQTAGSTVTFCGTVSAYTAPGVSSTGSIVFSSPATTYTIAAGTTVTIGVATPFTGSNVCLVGLVGASSQLVGVSITANPATPTSVVLCGLVSALTPATTAATGSITIGGIQYPLAIGAAAFTGTAITVGTSNVCLTATLNALGQITGGLAAANTVTGTTPISVCGTLSAYTPAASTTASATIAFSSPSVSYTVAPGVTVGNTLLATAGNLVCIVGQAVGTQFASVSFVPLLTTTVTVCGPVTAYVQPTTTTTGSVTVGGTVITIAANVLPSGTTISTGVNLCFVATLNTAQQATALAVSAAATATATPTATATGTPATATATATPVTLLVCGVISNYLAATSTTNGTLTINGTVLGIAPGAVFVGTTVAVNANVCISAALNSSQQITTAAVTANAVTPTATANVPAPPPPPGGTSTPTATPVPPTATATATAVPPTATPIPAVATPTPKPAKTPKPKVTATTAPPVAPAPGPAAAPTPVPAPAKLPATGLGGTSAFAHNAAVGRAFRSANGNVASLGIAAQPASGGSDPLNPAVPAILGLAAVGFGVLARKFGITRR